MPGRGWGKQAMLKGEVHLGDAGQGLAGEDAPGAELLEWVIRKKQWRAASQREGVEARVPEPFQEQVLLPALLSTELLSKSASTLTSPQVAPFKALLPPFPDNPKHSRPPGIGLLLANRKHLVLLPLLPHLLHPAPLHPQAQHYPLWGPLT